MIHRLHRGHRLKPEDKLPSCWFLICVLCVICGSSSSFPEAPMPTVAEIAAALEAFAPTQTAADWDNVGLLLGDPADPVERLMTCLTVTPEVVEEAGAERVHLIVSHPPILVPGARKRPAGRVDGRVVLPLARAGIAVYSPHTAFDNCPGGVNDILC